MAEFVRLALYAPHILLLTSVYWSSAELSAGQPLYKGLGVIFNEDVSLDAFCNPAGGAGGPGKFSNDASGLFCGLRLAFNEAV